MLKNNWIKLILTMGIALFSLIVIVMFHKNSKKQNRSKQKVEKRLVNCSAVGFDIFQIKDLFTMDNKYNIENVSETVNYYDKKSFPLREALFQKIKSVVK
ncbi:MAG: hypothetical protein IPK11_17590 [Ignavibacteria bacterium]|nr:hypothetical protein [Ignavibacteria bacterium]